MRLIRVLLPPQNRCLLEGSGSFRKKEAPGQASGLLSMRLASAPQVPHLSARGRMVTPLPTPASASGTPRRWQVMVTDRRLRCVFHGTRLQPGPALAVCRSVGRAPADGRSVCVLTLQKGLKPPALTSPSTLPTFVCAPSHRSEAPFLGTPQPLLCSPPTVPNSGTNGVSMLADCTGAPVAASPDSPARRSPSEYGDDTHTLEVSGRQGHAGPHCELKAC